MKKSTTKYNKVSNEIKKEIKHRYECGEAMFELSYEYKVNLGTLRNCASKEKWKKGRLKEIISMQEEQKITQTIIEEREKQEIIHKNLHKAILNGMNSRIEDGPSGKYIKPKEKKEEEAIHAILKSIATSHELYSKMYRVRTEAEEIDYKLKRLEFEKQSKEFDKEKENILLE